MSTNMTTENEQVEKEYQFDHIRLSAICSTSCNDNTFNNSPIILALHGWLDNSNSFVELKKQLPHFSWLCLDLSGHGKSQHRPKGCFYQLWDYVLDIVQLIKQLDTTIYLVGHSLGGAIAMLVASVIPEKVDRLILLDSLGPLTVKPSARIAKLQNSLQAVERLQNKKKRYYDSQEDMIAARMEGFTKLNYQAAKTLVERGSKFYPEQGFGWRHDSKLQITTPFSMDDESVNEFIKGIGCPTLLLLAEAGIYKANKALVQQRGGLIRDNTVKWLSGGHHFHLESETADQVANEIDYFLS